MYISLIKILSCALFIAEKQNKKILAILLKDYAKSQFSKREYLFLLILIHCYKENNIFINDKFYLLLNKYIYLFGNNICKYLLYYEMDNTN